MNKSRINTNNRPPVEEAQLAGVFFSPEGRSWLEFFFFSSPKQILRPPPPSHPPPLSCHRSADGLPT